MDIDGLAVRLETDLRSAGRPERAENEKRYLKSDLEHLGVRVPEIRNITRSHLHAVGELSHPELIALIRALWDHPIHEMRAAAVEVVNARVSDLEPHDLELLEGMLRTSRTWALVDALAATAVQDIVDRRPDADEVLERWAADSDFWIRRSALLVHLGPLRRGGGDWERFCRHADRMLEEKEFFIRKAIGWVLRDTARKRPDLVFQWILPRAARASGVTIREVVKRLSPDQAEQVLAAFKAQ